MKRWFSMMLLVGALLGLFAQEVALASASSMQLSAQTSASEAMSEDCAEMMGLTKQQPEKPCQELTLDCIAKMGCGLFLALVPPALSADPAEYRPNLPVLMPVTRLVGRNLTPEPEPPARLV